MSIVKKILFVIVLLALGYFLLPYVKVKPKAPANNNNQDNNQKSQSNTSMKTFVSDAFGAKFDYAPDQDGDSKADTDVKEQNDKIYVYYTAGPVEQGQWVQKFTKDPNVKLTDAVAAQFLKNISDKDCFATDMSDFYTKYGAAAPPLPEGKERVIIAYPFPTDTTQPFDQNASKCPQGYSLTNGLSYFEMDKNHPDKYYFFSIGQYAIFANPSTQTTWQDTFQVTK